MSRMSRLLAAGLSIAIFGITGNATAEIKLPSVVGSNMVLQQGCPVPIWGWADPGEEVTVGFAGQTKAATAAVDGRWEVKLDKLEATPDQKPQDMTIKGAGGDQLVLKNILIGEVWICSGQSNMEMGIGVARNGQAEIKAADHPEIRLFTVPKVMASEPVRDIPASWLECTPANVAVNGNGWTSFSAAAYYFGRTLHKQLKVPIGLIHTSWGGTPAEYWTSKEVLASKPALKSMAGQGENSKLFNGMIAPLVPFAIRGAIWYQGESNVGRAAQYRVLLAAMIGNWRSEWKQGDFPFGIVQIAPYNYRNKPSLEAEQWAAQEFVAHSVPHTGIVSTMDIGDLRDIHPKNKQEVGRRLALWALADVYGRSVGFSGPTYKSMEIDGNKIRISFDNIDGGLRSRDGKPLNEFMIAGADGKMEPAKAEIDGDSVVVSSDFVTKPESVEFAFHDTAQPNLENKLGLPAYPFRTRDDHAATAK